ncbi:hypothetical protein [Xenorhabdus doucetiae]|uniref:hypothetical protein n=1 Tax=Xenorhabdus doucetiae TaxID=351671 RepID=UPI002B4074FC|nr:hypothetical protein [Xenorhabdus sp. 3]
MRQSERLLRYCAVSVEYAVLPPVLTGYPHRQNASLDIVKFSFCCGVTFRVKPAKSDALSSVNSQRNWYEC